jgi:hypothetical protein
VLPTTGPSGLSVFGRHDGFRHLRNTGKESLDLFTALLKIGERSYAKITQQFTKASTELFLGLSRRIVVEDRQTRE